MFADAGIKTCVLCRTGGHPGSRYIGHTTEADPVIGGPVAGPLLNHEAASPLVTLIDFANTALGKTCPVPVYVDDEGNYQDAIIEKAS